MRRLALAVVLTVLVFANLVLAGAAAAWTWPTEGAVVQAFSFDHAHPYTAGQHRGVDVAGAQGETVAAPAAGSVSFAGTVPASGRSVTIDTRDGYAVTLTHPRLDLGLARRGGLRGRGRRHRRPDRRRGGARAIRSPGRSTRGRRAGLHRSARAAPRPRRAGATGRDGSGALGAAGGSDRARRGAYTGSPAHGRRAPGRAGARRRAAVRAGARAAQGRQRDRGSGNSGERRAPANGIDAARGRPPPAVHRGDTHGPRSQRAPRERARRTSCLASPRRAATPAVAYTTARALPALGAPPDPDGALVASDGRPTEAARAPAPACSRTLAPSGRDTASPLPVPGRAGRRRAAAHRRRPVAAPGRGRTRRASCCARGSPCGAARRHCGAHGRGRVRDAAPTEKGARPRSYHCPECQQGRRRSWLRQPGRMRRGIATLATSRGLASRPTCSRATTD